MLEPKEITLNFSSDEFQRVLSGPPETKCIKSGLVTLKPGESVGAHSTYSSEEVIIVLEGKGQLKIVNNPPLIMEYGKIVYCPPHTEHDVKNTGTETLKYIYIAANTENV